MTTESRRRHHLTKEEKAARREERVRALHEPDDEDGWTVCRDPRKTPFDMHPENCVNSSHEAFDAADELTYSAWVDQKTRHREDAAAAWNERVHESIAALYGLSAEEVRRRLSATRSDSPTPTSDPSTASESTGTGNT